MAAKKNTACLLRLQSDFQEFDTIWHAKLIIPNPDNLQEFIVRITPDHGIWANGKFDFKFTIPDQFPFERPVVKCQTRIWHPNIEETGAVCLNILRDNYTPVMSIAQMVVGLQFLFSEPNPQSPLNQEAATQYENDPGAFEKKAHEYMKNYCP